MDCRLLRIEPRCLHFLVRNARILRTVYYAMNMARDMPTYMGGDLDTWVSSSVKDL